MAEDRKSESQAYRLFVALPLPEKIKDEIEKAQAELRRALSEGCIRWARRDQFHLTLKFLGNVETQRMEELTHALRRACENFSPLKLRAEQIGFFPDARRPRVIWVGVNDEQEQLPLLQRAIEISVQEFTEEKSEDKFSGHVTLGRAKKIQRREAEILAKLAADMAQRFFGEWTADKVELIRSELSSGGARYTTLAAIPLAAA